jgi:hypothetical protein
MYDEKLSPAKYLSMGVATETKNIGKPAEVQKRYDVETERMSGGR